MKNADFGVAPPKILNQELCGRVQESSLQVNPLHDSDKGGLQSILLNIALNDI